MLLVYEGPPDQYDFEVGQALALARDHVTIELPDQSDGAREGDTVLATDVDGEASSKLEPGRVYDLPSRLATARLETSAHWRHVDKVADLNEEQLRRLAHERNVTGRSKLKGKDLAKAVSSATPATLPDPSPETAAPAGGDTSPSAAATAGTTTTTTAPAAPAAAPATTTPGGTT